MENIDALEALLAAGKNELAAMRAAEMEAKKAAEIAAEQKRATFERTVTEQIHGLFPDFLRPYLKIDIPPGEPWTVFAYLVVPGCVPVGALVTVAEGQFRAGYDRLGDGYRVAFVMPGEVNAPDEHDPPSCNFESYDEFRTRDIGVALALAKERYGDLLEAERLYEQDLARVRAEPQRAEPESGEEEDEGYDRPRVEPPPALGEQLVALIRKIVLDTPLATW